MQRVPFIATPECLEDMLLLKQCHVPLFNYLAFMTTIGLQIKISFGMDKNAHENRKIY